MTLSKLLVLSVLILGMLGCTTITSTDPTARPNKKAAEINTQLGVNYLGRGELVLADEKLRRALKQDPRSSTTHWVFALLQERLGENADAEKHFRKAISLNPKDSRAHNNYGAFLCNQDRIPEAEKEFLLAIENPLYAQAASAYANAGICVLKIPDKVAAEEYFQKSLNINPTQRSSLIQMAKLSFERNEFEQTSYYIQSYEKVGRHSSESLWIAFQSETNLGNKAKANDYADRLKKLYPSSQEARLLAETYWHAGKTK